MKVTRPLVWTTFYFVLGILGGTIGQKSYLFLLFLGFLIGLILLAWFKAPTWIYILCIAFCCFGYVRSTTFPLVKEKAYFKVGQHVVLTGSVKTIKVNTYGQTIVLDKVGIKPYGKMKSEVMIYSKGQKIIKLGDDVRCTVKVQEDPKKMNPSDMNYAIYLKGENIAAITQAMNLEIVRSHRSLFLESYEGLKERINLIFKGQDKGIIAKVLLGDDEEEDKSVTDVYYEVGVGHILSLSGFHIGILLGISLYLLSLLGQNYTKRYLLSIPFLWGYTLFTGMGVASVRACIMATIWIIGRCLWQEEDNLISLSLAAFFILFINPYQLYQVGFLLSFLAMLGVSISQKIIESVEDKIKSALGLKIAKLILPTFMISCVITPVVACTFYKVPIIGLFLNILVLPIFGVIIPSAIILLVLSMICLPLAQLGGGIINGVLMAINYSIAYSAKLPLATVCTGTLNGYQIVLYYIVVLLIVGMITGYIRKKYSIGFVVLIVIIYNGLYLFKKPELEIAQLYVGQGDCCVILTPTRQVMVIDSGSLGKGKVLRKYLNYKGYDKIDVAIISHGHEDHISGFIELLQEDLPIKAILIGNTKEDNSYIKQLKKYCKIKRVPLKFMQQGDTLSLGETKLRCLAPNKLLEANENDASLICTLSYRNFSQLFTGDISMEAENTFLDKLSSVDCLKVAHHGSGTSTSNAFLLKTRPKWGIISCGIGNRYGHPSSSTLERMEQYPIKVLSTDKQGCITVITEGKKMRLNTQLEEVICDD